MGMNSAVAGDQLRQYIQRIERLEEEKATAAADIRDVYAEAKGNGFDVKTIRQVIKIRKMDKAEREEQESLLELYLSALGMLKDTPLGRAAVDKITRGRVDVGAASAAAQ